MPDLRFKIPLKTLTRLFLLLENSLYRPLINHSKTTANAFVYLSKRMNLSYHPLKLYFTGLFHDISLLMMVLTEAYDQSYKFLLEEPNLESIVLEYDGRNKHSLFGSLFLKKIEFSTEFQKMLIYHHTPLIGIKETDEELVAAINCIQAADLISRVYLREDLSNHHEKIKFLLKELSQMGIDPSILSIIKTSDLKFAVYEQVDWEINSYYFSLEHAIQVMKVISYLLDARSRYTRNHSTVTSKVSGQIALELMGETDAKILELSALMHDMGKIKTPLPILHKKGFLTVNEMQIMKHHIVDTFEFLNESGLHYLSRIAASHHERLDGSGYPQGLVKSELTLYSRILQVADVYSALIEDRPYRNAMHPMKALEIIYEEVKLGKLDAIVYRQLEKLVKENHPAIKGTYYDVFEEFIKG